jgi:hypothetical protein
MADGSYYPPPMVKHDLRDYAMIAFRADWPLVEKRQQAKLPKNFIHITFSG